MPTLDVSEALTCPELADRICVWRRPEVVTDKGRTSTAGEEPIRNVVAVVCMAGPDDLERLPEEERMGRVISVVTRFRLRGPAKDLRNQAYQPDVLDWNGDRYVVSWIDPYNRYGSGFIQALAVATAAVQRPAD